MFNLQNRTRQYFCMNFIDHACMHMHAFYILYFKTIWRSVPSSYGHHFYMILIHSSPKKIPSGSFMLLISLSKITGQRKLNFWDEILFIFLKFNEVFATLGPGRRQWRTISFMSNNFPRRWSAMFHSDRFKLNIRNNGSRFFQEKIYVALFKGVILGSPVSLNS